jgi:hypothetical protein
VAQDLVQDRVQVRLWPVELNAGSGEIDRGLQELAPGKPAVAPVQGLEAGGGSGHGARCLADPEHLGRLAIAAEADIDRVHRSSGRGRKSAAGRRDEEIGDPWGSAVTGNDQGEATRAGPGKGAFGDPGGKRGCHAGIDRVSTLAEHPRACRRCERVPGRDRAIHAFVISADELCTSTPETESSPFPH